MISIVMVFESCLTPSGPMDGCLAFNFIVRVSITYSLPSIWECIKKRFKSFVSRNDKKNFVR